MYESILYAILTIFVIVPIEYLRILLIKNIKPNVNHRVSFLIGFLFYVLIVIFFEIWGWETLTFAFVCASIRGLLYDPFLNIIKEKRIDYQSEKSDNKTDPIEVKYLGKSFWVHRLFYLILTVFFIFLHTQIN